MASKLSDAKIRSETKIWSKKVKKIASKLKAKRKDHQSLIDGLNSINKNLNSPEYNKAQGSYDNYKSQASDLKAKIKKSKSKKTKSKLQGQLNDVIKKKSALSQKMNSIARNKGFTVWHNRKVRKEVTIRNSNKLIHSLEKQKSHAKGKYSYYRNTILTRHRNRIRKKNSKIMRKKIKHAKKHGASVLYRTDMMDSEVFWLYETSPSETNSNTVATHATDKNSVQTNYVALDSRELSGTYILQGKNLKDASHKYKKLMLWSRHYEFTIQGFSYWQHAYISSIGKSTDETMNKNALSLSISFTYAKQAKIQYSRTKSKRKAPAKKHKGSKSGTKGGHIRVKPGMTYAQIAKKSGTSLSHLMKINKWPANKLPVGAKVRTR
ncbi:LysM peptidoglycan-binding domain-containing protein (plasmid) [Apilactobacillus apisilvae]|uniref:LysM peptidoglycan-binding domain-containing protein n=1 Tax=Apilactobacillus apisilvae TaxID=2923364 RepID=A0ABY4PIY9_9LACO|nr:LysM domain-containing protein [Apilactobacillus apisilvae]UQS85788.1 LysM peptidoglycan-binding domain-containing protein [Apilactobacillus apisilvae]